MTRCLENVTEGYSRVKIHHEHCTSVAEVICIVSRVDRRPFAGGVLRYFSELLIHFFNQSTLIYFPKTGRGFGRSLPDQETSKDWIIREQRNNVVSPEYRRDEKEGG